MRRAGSGGNCVVVPAPVDIIEVKVSKAAESFDLNLLFNNADERDVFFRSMRWDLRKKYENDGTPAANRPVFKCSRSKDAKELVTMVGYESKNDYYAVRTYSYSIRDRLLRLFTDETKREMGFYEVHPGAGAIFFEKEGGLFCGRSFSILVGVARVDAVSAAAARASGAFSAGAAAAPVDIRRVVAARKSVFQPI